MKSKFTYLMGAAALVFCTSTFTSCINGVDDEYLDQKFTEGTGGGNSGEEEVEPLPDINGDYCAGGDFELTMTYNGEELTGKKVTVAADELNETAVITLAGGDTDLTEMLGGLMEFKFTSFSPVPGVEEITFNNVNLYASGESYLFLGEENTPAYTLSYQGTISDGKMNIDIKHELANQELAGTWNLAAQKISNPTSEYSPLWVDWDSNVTTSLGSIMVELMPGRPSPLPLNKYTFNGVYNLLAGAMSKVVMNMLLGQSYNLGLEDIIKNMLQSITAEKTGGMYATYSYSDDLKNPAWSSEMSHNILRYYFADNGQIRLEANADFLIGAIGGLINGGVEVAQTRGGDPEATKEIGRKLIARLIPLLQQGIPCDYELDGDNLNINIDGDEMREVLAILMELANDEYAHDFLMDALGDMLGDMKTNIEELLATMPNALKYHDQDPVGVVTETTTYSGECGKVRIGLKFTRN